MARYKGIFERFTEASQKTGDIMLRYLYQKSMIKDEMLTQAERARIVQETADLVLSRIHATVDVTEVFNAIDGLNEKINSLERK